MQSSEASGFAAAGAAAAGVAAAGDTATGDAAAGDAAAGVRTCVNLPYIGPILREFEIIPYYGHTYA